MGYAQIAREVLEEIRGNEGKDSNHVQESIKDPHTLLMEMNERIDREYREGDYSRLKQDKTFLKELEKKEIAISETIIKEEGYQEAIKDYEDYFKQGIWRLRLEEMTREEFEKSGKVLRCQTDSGRVVYIASSEELMEKNQEEGEVWFLPEEIEKLKGSSPEKVDKVIDIKEVFEGSKVIH